MARVYGIDNRAVYSPLAGLAQVADVALGYYQKKQDRNERKNERAEDRKYAEEAETRRQTAAWNDAQDQRDFLAEQAHVNREHDLTKLDTGFNHGVGLKNMEFGMGNWRDQQTRQHQVDILSKQNGYQQGLNQQLHNYGIARDNNSAINAESLAQLKASLGQGLTDAQIANLTANAGHMNERTTGLAGDNVWEQARREALLGGLDYRLTPGQSSTPLAVMGRPPATQTPAPTETQPNIFNFGADLGLGANAPSTQGVGGNSLPFGYWGP
jgi:hypothetical protein